MKPRNGLRAWIIYIPGLEWWRSSEFWGLTTSKAQTTSHKFPKLYVCNQMVASLVERCMDHFGDSGRSELSVRLLASRAGSWDRCDMLGLLAAAAAAAWGQKGGVVMNTWRKIHAVLLNCNFLSWASGQRFLSLNIKPLERDEMRHSIP
jgi:hypothetical protein